MGPGRSLRPKKGFQCSAESSSPVGCSIFVSNAEEEAVYEQGQEQGHQLGSRKNRLGVEGSTATLYFGYYHIWEMGLGGLGEQRVEGAAGSA